MYDICFCSRADGQPDFAPLHSSVDDTSSELVPDLRYSFCAPGSQSIPHLTNKICPIKGVPKMSELSTQPSDIEQFSKKKMYTFGLQF